MGEYCGTMTSTEDFIARRSPHLENVAGAISELEQAVGAEMGELGQNLEALQEKSPSDLTEEKLYKKMEELEAAGVRFLEVAETLAQEGDRMDEKIKALLRFWRDATIMVGSFGVAGVAADFNSWAIPFMTVVGGMGVMSGASILYSISRTINAVKTYTEGVRARVQFYRAERIENSLNKEQ